MSLFFVVRQHIESIQAATVPLRILPCVFSGQKASGQRAPRENSNAGILNKWNELVLEIAQGIFTPLVDRRDLIWPILWRGNGLY